MELQELKTTRKEDLATAGRILLIAAAALLLFAVAGHAQERTLINVSEIKSGGFGGPQIMYTTFNGEDGLLLGGQGAWVLNESVYLGGGGYGLTTHHDGVRNVNYSQTPQLVMGYGGVLFGVILQNDELLHLTADVMIGGGAVSNVVELRAGDPGFELDDDGYKRLRTSGFWHVQPMAHLELNLTDWMRVAVSGGYRLVRDFDAFGVSAEDASGPVAGLTIRFGSW